MIWKEIPGFPGYEVSEYGDVRSGAKLLKFERVNGNGRKRFSLSLDGRTFRFKAHQLVAVAFLGPPPFIGAEVCHRDDFEHNNHFSNLRWDTRLGNRADRSRRRMQFLRKGGAEKADLSKATLRAAADELLAR